MLCTSVQMTTEQHVTTQAAGVGLKVRNLRDSGHIVSYHTVGLLDAGALFRQDFERLSLSCYADSIHWLTILPNGLESCGHTNFS